MANILEIRDRDFVVQFNKSFKILRKTKLYPSRNEVIEHALTQPAPCYYIDFYRATAHFNKKSRQNASRNNRCNNYVCSRQWVDMEHDINQILKRKPGTPVNTIILDLCTGRAGNPRFYLSRRRANEIIIKALSNPKKNCGYEN